MPDARMYNRNSVLGLSASNHSRTEYTGLELTRLEGPARTETEKYVAVSPKGVHISIPKELFVALSDFIKTRKCPGSITLQFRGGEILGMESLAKKTYRK
jgi:hypothetical protein